MNGNLDYCLKCNFPLTLVSFYPEIINQFELIDEALNLNGFIGFLITNSTIPIGFSWGYCVPKKDTVSVAFEKITPLLKQNNINPNKAFYGAETGIIGDYQEKGLGALVTCARNLEAFKSGFEFYVNRTINPKMTFILTKIFSGKKPEQIFIETEKNRPWFASKFADIDLDYINKILKIK